MIPLRIVLASLACLCPFSLAQEPKSDPDKTLIIISTSDIHGNLDIAMGDYLCSNFIFPQRGNGKPTGIDVRKALIDYLKQIKKLLNPPPSKLPIIRDTTFAL